MAECGLDLSGSGHDTVAGFCEYSNDLSGTAKNENTLIWSATITFSKRTLINGIIAESGLHAYATINPESTHVSYETSLPKYAQCI
jgi:hypothetical protein